MRRVVAAGSLAAACALVVTACGGGTYVHALPDKVVGKIQQTVVKGDPAAGKKIFLGVGGCGGCHTLKAAGTNGKVGPDLDNVAADAKKANHGSLTDYIHESILSPGAYVVPGFSNAMPSFAGQLNEKQVADLVAYIEQSVNQKS